MLGGNSECLAGAVILATNPYSRRLVPGAPISPARAQMAATAREAHVTAERPAYADRGYQYWRQLSDGRLPVGGYRDRAVEEEVDAEPTLRVQGYLDEHLCDLGVRATVTHRWVGIMGFTEDELPIVGKQPTTPNVWMCAGCTGHGLGFAFHCAKRLAEALTGCRPATGLLA